MAILYGHGTTAWQISPNCQIFPIKPVLYIKIFKFENVVQADMLLTVGVRIRHNLDGQSAIR
jgi:hypothetical protein